MREHLEKFLASSPRKIVNTFDLEQYVIQELKDGYCEEAFSEEIHRLVHEDYLLPVTSRQKYGPHGLYNGYRKAKPVPNQNDRWGPLLNDLHPLISTAYYLENPNQMTADMKYILSIDRFLKNGGDIEQLTIQQRSFSLFKDEGFLGRRKGQALLQRLRLSYADLHCHQPVLPFVYSVNISENESPTRHILIAGGQDSFHTIRKLLIEGKDHFLQKRVDLLIFGDGDKIASSLNFFEEITPLQSKQNQFYYFGDVSYETFHFIRKLQKMYPSYDILPFHPLFHEMVKLDPSTAVIDRKWVRDKEREKDVREILTTFPPAIASALERIVLTGKYIPQAALTRRIYEKVFQRLEEEAGEKRN